MQGRRSKHAVVAGLAGAVLCVWGSSLAGVACAQFNLPEGFSASYHTEYSYGQSESAGAGESDPIFENWVDVDYTRGNFFGGLRYVAFQPPDPTIFPGDDNDSQGVDLAFGEYSTDRFRVRGGNFYALFGRGTALRLYEDRSLRVDTNALGASGIYFLPDGELTALIGRTVEGNAEDAQRGRTNAVAGVDVEHAVWSAANLRLGGSWVTTDLDVDGNRTEPLRMKAARAFATLGPFDLIGEFARVDGPNVFTGAQNRGFDGPNFHGRGFYGSIAGPVGPVGLLFGFKDYDALIFRNNAGIDHIVPPAVQRDHTFSLLNRHPHQLDTADERGFQVEATWYTDTLLERGPTTVLANYARTRNHDEAALGNLFDDVYVEVQQEIGTTAILGGLSYQRSLASTQADDPLRRLWTPVLDVRYPWDDRNSFHFQYEHQHDESQIFGEFDVDFFVLEWNRSPNLTVGALIEQTNKSELQLQRLGEEDTSFFAATLDYLLFGTHELRFFYGTRNAGFVCVGGVCRFEPAFDGFEMTLVSRF